MNDTQPLLPKNTEIDTMKKLQLLALTLWIALTFSTAYAQDLLQQHLPADAKMRLGKGRVYAMQFSPDGTQLRVASPSGIWHYDTQTGQEVDLIPFKLRLPLGYGAFSSDSSTFALGTGNSIYLIDAETGTLLKTLAGHTGRVRRIAFSPDGTMLASGSNDGTIRLWDVRTGGPLKTLTGHTNVVWSVSFSADGKTLASGSWDRTIRLWDCRDG